MNGNGYRALLVLSFGFCVMGGNCAPPGVDPLAPQSWQQLHSGSKNSSFNSAHSVPASLANLKWSVFTGVAPLASPVTHPNGNIYIATPFSELVGVTPGGQIALRRSFATGEIFMTSPAIDRFGDIYLIAYRIEQGSRGNAVSCRLLRIAPNGNILREAPIPVTMSSPKIANDMIFITSRTELIVLNRDLAEITRAFAGGGGDICGSTGFYFLDRLLTCIPGDFLCYFVLEPGQQPREPSPAITTDANLTNPDEPLIVVCNYPGLVCFKLVGNTLQRQWAFELDTDVCDDNNPSFTSPAIVLGGVVLVGYNSDNLVAFDILTGEHIWSVANSGIIGAPSAGLGDAYAATLGQLLRVRGNGTIARSESIGNGGFSAPAVTLDHVFVANPSGLFTFSLTLDPISHVPIEMSRHSDPVVDASGTVYVLSDDGFLQAFGGSPVAAFQLPSQLAWTAPQNAWSISYRADQPLDFSFAGVFTGAGGVHSDRDGKIGAFSVPGGVNASCRTTRPLTLGRHDLVAYADDTGGTNHTARITVNVVNHPPAVQIVSPVATDSLSAGSLTTLAAEVADVDEAAFPDSRIRWHSSLTGDLGVGRTLQVALAEGIHALTCTVTDEMGAQSAASIQVSVASTN